MHPRSQPGLLAALPLAGLFAALALALLSPAQADLAFPAACRHEAQFRAVYARLPPRYARCRVTVGELPAAEWRVVEDFEGLACLGAYVPERRSVWIAADQDPGELAGTLAHELAHDLWAHDLTRGERDEWRGLFGAHLDWMPTRPARSNANEGFAWCCEWFTRGKALQPEVRDLVRRFLDVDDR